MGSWIFRWLRLMNGERDGEDYSPSESVTEAVDVQVGEKGMILLQDGRSLG
jgi:hypothetical protein